MLSLHRLYKVELSLPPLPDDGETGDQRRDHRDGDKRPPPPPPARRPAHKEVTERRQLSCHFDTRGMWYTGGRGFHLCLFSFHIKVTGLKCLQEDATISQVSWGYITM